jgi:cell division protein FtsL
VSRFNALLAFLLVVCALGLVTSQHRARKLFIDLEHAQNQARQLDVRWNRLRLEQTRLATASLIDSKARAGLAMQPVTPQRTLYLTLDTPAEQTAMEAGR